MQRKWEFVLLLLPTNGKLSHQRLTNAAFFQVVFAPEIDEGKTNRSIFGGSQWFDWVNCW